MDKSFIGTAAWLIALREGAFSNQKPIPWEPPCRHIPARKISKDDNLSPVHGKPHAAIGRKCSYCRRQMSFSYPGLRPTKDHVHPRSKGGRYKVWACDDCNGIKSNMTFVEWQEYMSANPQWWLKRKRNRPPAGAEINWPNRIGVGQSLPKEE